MSDRFDYETARKDLWDIGMDPDELPERNPERRDDFLRKVKLDPNQYKPPGRR